MPRITYKEKLRFREFHDSAIEKLDSEKNSKKRHWRQHGVRYLLKRLKDEVEELESAIEAVEGPEAVIDECRDVSNFAMFIADIMNVRGESH